MIVILAVIFLAVTLAALAGGMMLRDARQRQFSNVDRRLQLDRLSAELPPTLPTREQPQGGIDRAFVALVEESAVPLDVNTCLLLVLGCGAVVGGLVFVLTDNLLGTAGAVLAGCLLPIVWLAFTRWSRIRKLRKNLPETLQIMADNVRAGHTLEVSADMVAREMKGPLGQEFAFCAQQLRLGHSPVMVFEKMARRIPLPEFRIFATAVVVHRRTGGNLALLTQRLSGVARDRQEFHGHLGAVTAGSRLSAVGLLIGTVVAVVLLSMIQPAYISRFLTSPIGPTLLIVAAGLWLIGIFWISRILKISY